MPVSTMLVGSALALLAVRPCAAAQSNTGLPVPPLQWLRLPTSGEVPPGLRNAAMGYDPDSATLIIFGGESNGQPQSQTYLLDLKSSTWSTPNPPDNLKATPPARSRAISASDFAASNRHSFVIVGGQGEDGNGLSDVWEFDYNNKFWSMVMLNPGGPSPGPRWSASGGVDIRTPFHSSGPSQGPNNTVYLSGGTNGKTTFTDGIWSLELGGTLSSNLPNNTFGSWSNLDIGKYPSRVNASGTVIGQSVISAGSCPLDGSGGQCSLQDFQVLDASLKSAKDFDGCPTPRRSPVLVPNLNAASSSFASQAFLLLGTFDESVWQDSGGLDHGEVDMLDMNIGTWTRILPSGDPGTDGEISFPALREGAAAFSFTQGLVGSSQNSVSDTVIFGGQDKDGKYLQDLWLLRSYNERITSSNLTFKAGQLSTGPDASGTGVNIKFLTECASTVSGAGGTTGPTSTSPSTASPTGGTASETVGAFDTSAAHKIFGPVSVALLLLAVAVYRFTSPTHTTSHFPTSKLYFTSYLLGAAGWGIGIASIVTSFTGIMSQAPAVLVRRLASGPTPTFLATGHSKAGFIIFVCLYGIVPVMGLLLLWRSSRTSRIKDEKSSHHDLGETVDLTEKAQGSGHVSIPSRPGSPRSRTHSWGPSTVRRSASDSESESSAPPPKKGFEVLSRPRRRTGSIGHTLSPSYDQPYGRHLRDVDWLQRRRSLTAVGELDYAITQSLRTPHPPTPATGDGLISSDEKPVGEPIMPHLSTILFRCLLHTLLLALCILTLVALWQHSPKYGFALMFALTVVFYISTVISAFHHTPPNSILSISLSRLRGESAPSKEAGADTAASPNNPYLNMPPHRVADESSYTQHARSVENGDSDSEADEDTRQRRIEEEMNRRQIVVTTIPKRSLWIVNPGRNEES